MCLHFPKKAWLGSGAVLSLIVWLTGLAGCALHSKAHAARKLRVCADPNNLPFSNQRLEGFENKIAELLARELDAKVEYTWWAQRRGFIRNTLKVGACDLVMGVPRGFELAQTSVPYYRSTYVFVFRQDRAFELTSFDDPILRRLKIGVQLVGDDGANPPPAHALASRGIVQNVRGYTVYGDYAEANPTARIIEAVASGEIDVAIAWGPMAGYFARQQKVPLTINAVSLLPASDANFSPRINDATVPFVYDISLGVRRGEKAFKDELESALTRCHKEIEKILDDYGVPRLGA